MDCQEAILSEQTYDYITDFPVDEEEVDSVLCTEDVGDRFHVIYVDNGALPSLEVDFYEYQGIPKLYGLMQIGGDESMLPKEKGAAPTHAKQAEAASMHAKQEEVVRVHTNEIGAAAISMEPFDPAAIISSGISQVQGPPLNLTGFGTLLCFIDTGIDFENELFRDELGNTRIEAIWDQTDQTGTPPEGFLYGSLYTREQINYALRNENPKEIVPTIDEIGHGTALASVAAGSVFSGFRGAAPEAGLVIVKLKPAKDYLKKYYLLPSQALAYQENDIMLAVKFCESFVRLFRRPVVICLGIGTSMGNHAGSSPLSSYLNQVALKRNLAVVVCGGNEGNGAGHFRGSLAGEAVTMNMGTALGGGAIPTALAQSNVREVEIRVSEGNGGFYMELWGRRTNVINVEIRSPGGEVIPPIPLGLRQSITFSFVYERTRVTIYSTLVEPTSGEELIYFRFVDPTPGIWTLRVIGQGDTQGGIFDLWLPLLQFQQSPVYFLSPHPDVTLTEPAMAMDVIATTAYNPANASFYIDSGRGFSRNGMPRPDLSAPGVNVSTAYGKQSGSGFSAALTAGAVAQLMQWAVVEGNNAFADTRVIKGYLLRGARREADISYPSKEWGFGRLDMAGTFTSLRG